MDGGANVRSSLVTSHIRNEHKSNCETLENTLRSTHHRNANRLNDAKRVRLDHNETAQDRDCEWRAVECESVYLVGMQHCGHWRGSKRAPTIRERAIGMGSARMQKPDAAQCDGIVAFVANRKHQMQRPPGFCDDRLGVDIARDAHATLVGPRGALDRNARGVAPTAQMSVQGDDRRAAHAARRALEVGGRRGGGGGRRRCWRQVLCGGLGDLPPNEPSVARGGGLDQHLEAAKRVCAGGRWCLMRWWWALRMRRMPAR